MISLFCCNTLLFTFFVCAFKLMQASHCIVVLPMWAKNRIVASKKLFQICCPNFLFILLLLHPTYVAFFTHNVVPTFAITPQNAQVNDEIMKLWHTETIYPHKFSRSIPMQLCYEIFRCKILSYIRFGICICWKFLKPLN